MREVAELIILAHPANNKIAAKPAVVFIILNTPCVIEVPIKCVQVFTAI